MSDPRASAIIYQSVVERIRSGEWIPGDKIEAAPTGRLLGFTHIPATSAFGRLHGEGLLDYRPNIGFTVAAADYGVICHLLETHFQLLNTSCHEILVRKEPWTGRWAPFQRQTASPIDAMENLFNLIATTSGNPAVIRYVDHINDRFHWARLNEGPYCPEPESELAELVSTWNARDYPALETCLSAYHRIRQGVAYDLAKLANTRNPTAQSW